MVPLHRRVWQRLRDLVAWSARDEEIREEMQFHLESLAREHMAAGLPEHEAWQAAHRRFGRSLSLRERAREVRGAGLVEDLVCEIRQAGRRLLRAPAFTAAAALTLALAIGANAAIFTVVHRVLLNPLLYPDSNRLVALDHGAAAIDVPSGIGLTTGLYYQYVDRARTLEAVAIYRLEGLTVAGEGEPEWIGGARTTSSLPAVLRVPPAQGRWFTEAEGAPGAAPVAVLSHGLWTRRYGGDPGIVGQSLTIGGVPTEIVGIMPASFEYPDPRVDVWLPEPMMRTASLELPFSYAGVARARPGMAMATIRQEIDGLIADLPQAYPADPGAAGWSGEGGLRSAAISLKEVTVGPVAQALWVLLAAAGVVLLVACANVANLFLVRSEARQREVGIRRALGASAASIRRYFLAESLLIALAAALIGLALAWGAVRVLVALGPTLPRLAEVRLDSIVVAFTVVLAVLAALALGAMPFRRRAPLTAALHGGRSHTTSPEGQRTRQLLMGAQIALALLLLVSSGLMVRSFQTLRAVDPGFTPDSAMTFLIGLPERAYPDRAAVVATHLAILERLSVLPGVTAASASTGVPLAESCFGNAVFVRGRAPDPDQRVPFARLCATTGERVEAWGLRLLRGRAIERQDVERAEANAVVNQAFVDTFFPDEDPLGQQVRSSAPEPPEAGPDQGMSRSGAPPWLTVVGVVSNTPARALAEPDPVPALYMPVSIARGPDMPMVAMHGPDVSGLTYVVRTSVPPWSVLPSMRAAVAEVDPTLALAFVRTLQDIIDGGLAQMTFTMLLITIAAGVALLLGLIGIYGVVAYVVGQRTNELGVRMALGAEPAGVVAMIVGQGARVAVAGIGIGVGIALAGSRLIESLLYGVSPRDPVVFTGTAIALLGVALLACWIPARRAARINPTDALRAD